MDKNYSAKRISTDSRSLSKIPSKENSAWKPKKRVAQEQKSECPFCHAVVSPLFVICPSCGRSLTPEKCSFCGAPKRPTAKYCTHCGQPSQGVICPQCGTLNSRNFCRKCNHPLTPMAQRALEAAQTDPAFRRVKAKADELAELHTQIEQLRNNAPGEEQIELSQQDKALLDEYADLLGMIGSQPSTEHKSESVAPARKQYALSTVNIDDLLKAYKEKAAEMNEALAALTPPPEYTPEQQRDYFAARKVATVVTETTCDMSAYNPTQWRCNFCSNLHDTPSECAHPELGGVWEYISVEEYISTHAKDIKTSLNIK